MDVGRRPSPPLLSYFARATTSRASAGRHIVAAVFHARVYFFPSLLCSAVPVDNTRPISISFPLAVRTLSPITTAAPLLPSGELLAAVGSHHRPPIVPTEPLANFPNPCSCSPASKRRRISAGASLPMTAAHRCPLLALEHPFLTLLDSNWPHTELPHTALKLPDPFLAAHDHRSAAAAILLRRRLPALIVPLRQAAPNPIPSVYRCAKTW
jgi:hypothetical protein